MHAVESQNWQVIMASFRKAKLACSGSILLLAKFSEAAHDLPYLR
jgi:hypothetical protein